jgi:hypothetical protein
MSLRSFPRCAPVLVLVLAVAPVGCGLALGLGDYTDQADTTTTGSTGGGATTTSTSSGDGGGGSGGGTLCQPGAVEPCYDDDSALVGHGLCVAGEHRCNDTGTAYGACEGQVLPVAETCATQGDDDCDDEVNEDGVGCDCTPGTTMGCYSGPAGTSGIGLCSDGTQACKADGTGYEACTGDVTPKNEDCGDPADEDCDKRSCSEPMAFIVVGTASPQIRAVAFDTAGNMILAGQFLATFNFAGGAPLIPAGQTDVFVAKFDPTGAHLWSKRFGDSQGQAANSVATDPMGNIVVGGGFGGVIDFGGSTLTSAGLNDAFVVKLDPDGGHMWSKRYGGTSNESNVQVATGPQGEVGITGTFGGTAAFGGLAVTSVGQADVFVTRLDANGAFSWSKAFGTAGTESLPRIGIDGAGSVFVGGNYEAASFTIVNTTIPAGTTFVLKFDAGGTLSFWRKFGDAAGGPSLSGMAVDGLGNVIVGGMFQTSASFGGPTLTPSGATERYLAKLNGQGTHAWSNTVGAVDEPYSTSMNITADSTGHIGVAGETYSGIHFGGSPLPGSGFELTGAYLVRLDPQGVRLWGNSYTSDTSSLTVLGVGAHVSSDLAIVGSFGGTVDFGSGPVAAVDALDAFALRVAGD